jgi:hypothetical protein
VSGEEERALLAETLADEFRLAEKTAQGIARRMLAPGGAVDRIAAARAAAELRAAADQASVGAYPARMQVAARLRARADALCEETS